MTKQNILLIGELPTKNVGQFIIKIAIDFNMLYENNFIKNYSEDILLTPSAISNILEKLKKENFITEWQKEKLKIAYENENRLT